MRRLPVFLCLTLLLLLAGYVLYPLPTADTPGGERPVRFYISGENSFERQGYNQCSAYAAAYVMRHFGWQTDGGNVYERIRHRLPVEGYVLPRTMVRYFGKHELTARVYRGNLDSLKHRLTLGSPVIVVIGEGFKWQHYLTLVGYDDELGELYFFDSQYPSLSSRRHPGNRTMREEVFLALWNNGLPIFNHFYIGIDQLSLPDSLDACQNYP